MPKKISINLVTHMPSDSAVALIISAGLFIVWAAL